MTTLETVLKDRAERGLGEILFEIYCCAYASGARMVCDADHSEGMASLIALLADRHRVEVLLPRGWADPPATNDELPGWLLSLSQQRDVIEPPPVEGWPPEGA
jgi:hypothetical protein